MGYEDGVSWEAVVGCGIRNELYLFSYENAKLNIDSTLNVTFEMVVYTFYRTHYLGKVRCCVWHSD